MMSQRVRTFFAPAARMRLWVRKRVCISQQRMLSARVAAVSGRLAKTISLSAPSSRMMFS